MSQNTNADLEQQLQACRTELAELARAVQAERTARQQAEDALRETERRFGAVFEQTFQFAGLLTPEGILLEANQTALDFGGFQRQDVVGRPFWEARWWTISPETQEQLREAISQAAAGQFVRYEVDVIGAGERVVTIDFSLKPVKDETGRVVLLIPEGRDITELKQAARQELYRQRTNILESITDAFFAVDRNWHFTYVNSQAERVLQKTRDELLGENMWDVYPQAIGTTFDGQYRRAMEEKISFCVEEFCSPLSAWFDVQLYPVENGLSVYFRDITARKQAEEALHQREQEFRALAENAPDIISRLSKQLRFLYVNAAVEPVTGLSPQAFIGKTHQELGMPETVYTYWEDNLQQVFTTGCERIMEFDFLTPDGTTRYYQTRLVPEFAKDGSVETIMSIARDVTDFKQTETALRQSQQLLQAILAAAPIATYLKDLQGRYILVNRRCEDALGLSREQIIGKTDYDLWPQEMAEDFQSSDRAALKAGTPLEWEQVSPEAGELRTFITTKFPLYDAAGNPYAVGGISTEITERKQMETALRESEERFRQLAENVDVVFWVFSLDEDKTLYISPAYERIWDRTRESIYKQPLSWQDSIHPEDLPTLVAARKRQRQGEFSETVYRIVLNNGSIRWIRDRAFPVRNAEGRIYRLTGIAEDISDAYRQAAQRQQAQEQLKVSLQEKEALLKEVHHRVKNNLQIISSLLDLQSQQLQDSIALEAFRASRNRVKSIAIIHEKLYQSESLAKLNLADYIHSLTIDLLQTYPINPDNITLQLKVDEIFLNLDRVIPLGLIVNELVSNALKHGFPGDTQGTIWLELKAVEVESIEEKGHQCTLTVGNDGIKLQDPQTLCKAKSLGFQLVNILVDQLEGQIEITQNPNTEFKISFSALSSSDDPRSEAKVI